MSCYLRLTALRAAQTATVAPVATVYVRDASRALNSAYAFTVHGHDKARLERLQAQIAEHIGASHGDLNTHTFALYNAATGEPVRNAVELDRAARRAGQAWLRYEVGGRLKHARPEVPALQPARPAAPVAKASSSSATAPLTAHDAAQAVCASVAAVAARTTAGPARNAMVRAEAERVGTALMARLGAARPHEVAGAVARDLVHAVNEAEPRITGGADARAHGFKVLLARAPVWKQLDALCRGETPAPAGPAPARHEINIGAGMSAKFHKTLAAPTTKLDAYVVPVKDAVSSAAATDMEGRDHIRESGYRPIDEQLVGKHRDKDDRGHGHAYGHRKHHHHGLLGIHSELGAAPVGGLIDDDLVPLEQVGCHRCGGHKKDCPHCGHHTRLGRLAHRATGGLLHSEAAIGAAIDDDLVPLQQVGCHRDGRGKSPHHHHHHHTALGQAVHHAAQDLHLTQAAIGARLTDAELEALDEKYANETPEERRRREEAEAAAMSETYRRKLAVTRKREAERRAAQPAPTGTAIDDDLVPLAELKRVGASRAAALDDDLVPIGACSAKHAVQDLLCGLCHKHHAEGKCPLADPLGLREHPHRDEPALNSITRNLLYSASRVGASRAAPLDDDLVPLDRVGASRAAALDDDLVPLADLKRGGASPAASRQQQDIGLPFLRRERNLLSAATGAMGCTGDRLKPKADASMAALSIGNAMCHRDGENTYIDLYVNGELKAVINDGSSKMVYVPGAVNLRLKVMRGDVVVSPEHVYKFEPNHLFPTIISRAMPKLAFVARLPRVDTELFGANIGARVDSSISGVTVSLTATPSGTGRLYRLGADYAEAPAAARYLHISTASGQSNVKPEPLQLRPGHAHSIALYRDAAGAIGVHAQSDTAGERVRAAAAPAKGAIDFGAF